MPMFPLSMNCLRLAARSKRPQHLPSMLRLAMMLLAVLMCTVLVDRPEARGDETGAAGQTPSPPPVWSEGATVTGWVLDHSGTPVENAEVLLLGKERIIVDADRRNWFVREKTLPNPTSTRTDKNGRFSITRKLGTADRLAVITKDPLFWVVPRSTLLQDDELRITLPRSGSLAVQCELPGKPAKQPVMIELKSFDGVTWNADSLRFHSAMFSLANPGETVFDHLPPGTYAVQRHQHTKTGPNTTLMTGADRQLVTIESAKRAEIRFDQKVGRPLSGQVKGLENVELRTAYLIISGLGPEEILEKGGKPSRIYVAFDVIPITGDGRFTTDPIPPGKYITHLFAVRDSTPPTSSGAPDFSGNSSFTIPEAGEHPVVEIVAKENAPRDLSNVTDLRARVVDPEGHPLSKFQAMIRSANVASAPWIDGRNGMVYFGGERYREDATACEVLVRADGYSPTIARFTRNQLSKGEAEVKLPRGQKIQLQFKLPDGVTWPKGTLPEAYFGDLQASVRMMRTPENRRGNIVSDFNMLNLHEVGDGQFEFWAAEDTLPFHVGIHAPGFLQYFETGPFRFADLKSGKLEIDVPRPASLDVSFEHIEPLEPAAKFKNVSLQVYWKQQGNSMYSAGLTTAESLAPSLKIADLAPGDYMINIRTQPKDGSQPLPDTEINLGAYSDRTTLTLRAGQAETVKFQQAPFDRDVFRGENTATLNFRTPEGEPAKDRKISVTYYDGHYGSVAVFSGVIPESGSIKLDRITGKSLSSSKSPYTVKVDGKRLGSFGFTNETSTQEFEFALIPGVGDLAPDLELTNLTNGNQVRLSSFRGQVVFLEFWATWCGPCQQPMTKLNKLAGDQGAAWKDRVALVPVSIDSEQARITKHAEQRGWSELEPYWSGKGEGSDFEAPGARAYVVSGIPDAILIGPDGRILWRGHPMDSTNGEDLKSRIEGALKQFSSSK